MRAASGPARFAGDSDDPNPDGRRRGPAAVNERLCGRRAHVARARGRSGAGGVFRLRARGRRGDFGAPRGFGDGSARELHRRDRGDGAGDSQCDPGARRRADPGRPAGPDARRDDGADDERPRPSG